MNTKQKKSYKTHAYDVLEKKVDTTEGRHLASTRTNFCLFHFLQSTANKREEAIENLRSAAASGLKLVQTHFRRINMRAEDFDEVDDPTFTPGPVFEPLVSLCFHLNYIIYCTVLCIKRA